MTILFYDGGCGLCHAAVRLLLRLDVAARLRLAPLGGATFERLVGEAQRRGLPDSLVLRTASGALLLRSEALAEALRLCGGAAVWLGAAVRLLPRSLADRAYDALARRRVRLFGRAGEACPVPPGPLRARFLP